MHISIIRSSLNEGTFSMRSAPAQPRRVRGREQRLDREERDWAQLADWDKLHDLILEATSTDKERLWPRAREIFDVAPPDLLPVGIKIDTSGNTKILEDGSIDPNWNGVFCQLLSKVLFIPAINTAEEFKAILYSAIKERTQDMPRHSRYENILSGSVLQDFESERAVDVLDEYVDDVDPGLQRLERCDAYKKEGRKERGRPKHNGKPKREEILEGKRRWMLSFRANGSPLEPTHSQRTEYTMDDHSNADPDTSEIAPRSSGWTAINASSPVTLPNRRIADDVATRRQIQPLNSHRGSAAGSSAQMVHNSIDSEPSASIKSRRSTRNVGYGSAAAAQAKPRRRAREKNRGLARAIVSEKTLQRERERIRKEEVAPMEET
ncbi:uncharacterized protein PAC_11526 [Phialocephala subalpina]|uniref:Uncharacterized protein n=1 Tax=Phialocephala subalpina TaxID=576137 RepID=A0A1L7X9C5_9HELO|nr:uncharacterized protein PAC_11526 [Phialocephala subalpina]